MPISYGSNQKQLKIGSISLNSDGSMTINVQYGYVENSIFMAYVDRAFNIIKADADVILNALPSSNGLTRRQDFSNCIYEYLMANSLIETGEIT